MRADHPQSPPLRGGAAAFRCAGRPLSSPRLLAVGTENIAVTMNNQIYCEIKLRLQYVLCLMCCTRPTTGTFFYGGHQGKGKLGQKFQLENVHRPIGAHLPPGSPRREGGEATERWPAEVGEEGQRRRAAPAPAPPPPSLKYHEEELPSVTPASIRHGRRRPT